MSRWSRTGVGSGERVIDFGGEAVGDTLSEGYDGDVMIVFAIDPGMDSGWSALKIPVGLIGTGGVARTLVRCRHLHGTVGRSGATLPSAAGGAWCSTDSAHVTEVFAVAGEVWDEWMPQRSDFPAGKEGKAEFKRELERYRFVFVMEGFDLRMISMDPSLLAPVRVAAIFMDRLVVGESPSKVLFQKVADAKNVVTDTRLKRWGMYDPSSGAHARDADRHGILFLRKFSSEIRLRRALWGRDPITQG